MVVVLLPCVLFSGCRNQVSLTKAPFSFHGIEGWSIRLKDHDDAYDTYQLERGTTTFDITVNPRNRDLISCFCAPMDSYTVTQHGDATCYELVKVSPDGAQSYLTMKVQGPTSSLDVHYTANSRDEDVMAMILLLRSLRTNSPSTGLSQVH